MSIKDSRKGRHRVQCTPMKEADACDHRRPYDLETVERTVLDGLKANLTHPDLIVAYVESYNAERKRLAAKLIASRSRLERRLADVQGEITRLVQSYTKGHVAEDDFVAPMQALRAARTQIKADLDSADKPPEFVTLHPTALVRYRRQVEDLASALKTARSADDDEPIRALRDLVAAVVVMPTPPGAPIQIEVRGRLAALIDHPVYPAAKMWGN